MSQRPQEEGYALIAAVASIVVLALFALAVLNISNRTIITGRAEVDQAQATAAADAGIALAVHHLLAQDVSSRWSIDGRTESVDFAGAQLAIKIEDERGKVPINLIDEVELTRLLETAGLSGDRLEIARASLLDWRDDDDEPRTNGAERDYYAPHGYAPRNGALLSLEELGRVRGYDAALIAKMRPYVTVNWSNGSFDPRFANPQALNILQGDGGNPTEAINRARELAGQRTALDLANASDFIGKPLSVQVDAILPDGGHARRTEVIELTGSEVRPYVIRNYQ